MQRSQIVLHFVQDVLANQTFAKQHTKTALRNQLT